MTPKLVSQVEKYQIRDIPSAGFESDPTPSISPYETQLVSSLRTALTPAEAIIYDYMFGRGGKPKVESTGQIAKRIGKSDSHVSRIKKRIEAKYKSYI